MEGRSLPLRTRIATLSALVVGLSLTPLFWFRDGELIEGGDTNFPLRPGAWFEERLFAWNANVNTGADASHAFGGLTFHGLQAALSAAGLSLVEVERWTFVFWFLAIGLSMYFLAAVLDRGEPKVWLRLAAVFFYTFNTYLFNVWEVAKVANLALYVSLPLVIGLLVLALERRLRLASLAALLVPVAILGAGVGVNPPYALVLLLAVGILFLVALTRFRARDVARVAAVFTSVYLVASLYWVLPLVHVASGGGVRGVADLNAANWVEDVSRNTSLLNVARLIGAWDWFVVPGDKPYQSFAETYLENPVLIVLSFALPLLAWARVLVGPMRWDDWYLFLLAVLGIALAAGAHRPFGGVYLWLTTNVPFFSLLRSPWYIFTPLIAVAYALLARATLAAVWGRARGRLVRAFPRHGAAVSAALAAVAVAASLFYAKPLLAGEIHGGPESANDLTVSVPSYVFDAARWLEDKPGNGRIFLLPRDKTEVLEWGYAGVLPVLNLFSVRPVLHQPYENVASGGSEVMRTRAYEALYRGDRSAPFLLGALGVEYVNYRHDARAANEAGYPPLRRRAVAAAARLERRFGEWEFLRLPDRYRLPHVYAATRIRPARELTTARTPRDERRRTVFVTAGRGDTVLARTAAGRVEAPRISVRRVNPAKYVVRVRDARRPYALVLGETFQPGWKAYVGRRAGGLRREVGLETWGMDAVDGRSHFVANGYANGWLLRERGDYEVVVEYAPQRAFVVGLGISFLALLASAAYLASLAARRAAAPRTAAVGHPVAAGGRGGRHRGAAVPATSAPRQDERRRSA